MLSPIFHGKVSDDGERLELSSSERQKRRGYLKYLAGQRVDVIIRKHQSQRSLDQNAYIHAVPVAMIAAHCGNTMEEMKLILMGECWGWKADAISGREIPVKPHTSSMTVEEASHFIEWVGPWALEKFGMEIPLPGEVSW